MPIELIVPDENESLDGMASRVATIIKLCRKQLGDAGGVILVRFPEGDGPLQPGDTSYLHLRSGHGNVWHRFGVPTEAEDPLTFNSAAVLMREWLADIGREDEVVCPAVWVHPDAGRPLPKYLLVTGAQFPGSPRR